MAARQHRRIKPARASRGNAGYTLVEVMVAMLLTSIMVTSVFSVALTVKTGGNKGESKIKAAAGARMVAALLKNYVTAATGAPTNAIIPGPCGAADLNWSISCNGIVDSCPGGGSSCYALAHGTHTLSGVMGDFENAPTDNPPGKSAYVSYHVDANTYDVNGRPVPVVTITANWTD